MLNMGNFVIPTQKTSTLSSAIVTTVHQRCETRNPSSTPFVGI